MNVVPRFVDHVQGPQTAPHLPPSFLTPSQLLHIVIQARALRVVCLFLFVIEANIRGTIAGLDSSRLRHFMCAVMSELHAGQHARQPGEPRMQQLLRYLPSKPCFVFVSLHISAVLAFLLPLLLTLSCTSLAVPTLIGCVEASSKARTKVGKRLSNHLWAQAVMVK